jgi:phosphoribosylamine--glycine ligase
MASGGYPGDYQTGKAIHIPAGLLEDPDVIVFHAGTRFSNGELVTSGGRVLAVTAVGKNTREAAERSRRAVEAIRFEGQSFRRDIGWREIQRLNSTSTH